MNPHPSKPFTHQVFCGWLRVRVDTLPQWGYSGQHGKAADAASHRPDPGGTWRHTPQLLVLRRETATGTGPAPVPGSRLRQHDVGQGHPPRRRQLQRADLGLQAAGTGVTVMDPTVEAAFKILEERIRQLERDLDCALQSIAIINTRYASLDERERRVELAKSRGVR